MTIRATSAMLPTFVAAVFLTCIAWPGYATAGPGQGTLLGVSTASLMATPTQDSIDMTASDQPLIYAAKGPGQGTVLLRSPSSLLA